VTRDCILSTLSPSVATDAADESLKVAQVHVRVALACL
jgi:hypothetical protein